MKFTAAAIAPLLLSTFVAARGVSLFGSEQATLDDALKIPGDNPLNYCQAEHSSDLITIDHVNLTPNPPLPGQTLTIEAIGTALEDVDEGAYVVLQVKYGLIRLINTKADLCEQVQNVDMKCPIKKGEIKVTKDVEIPNEIPPGKYTVFADVYDKDDSHLVCLTATVIFKKE